MNEARLVALALGVLALAAGSAPARAAAVINVPADHTTIQAAIDAAVDGDTILVAKGTYKEHPLISSRPGLTLRATGGAVVLKGAKGFSGITVENAPRTTIDGFTVKNAGAHGIFVTLSDGTVVANCVVQGAKQDGIRADGSIGVNVHDCKVSKVKVIGITFGVGAATVYSGFIKDCTITGCGDDGIDVNGGLNEVRDNVVSKTKKDGIALDSSGAGDGCLVADNTVSKIKRYGLLITRNGHTVRDNHTSKTGFDGMDVNGTGTEIHDNTFDKPGGDGLWTDGSSLNIHDNVTNSPKDDGFDIEGANNTVTFNTSTKAKGSGFEVNGTGNTFTSNTASKSKKKDLVDTNGPGPNTYVTNTFGTSNLP